MLHKWPPFVENIHTYTLYTFLISFEQCKIYHWKASIESLYLCTSVPLSSMNEFGMQWNEQKKDCTIKILKIICHSNATCFQKKNFFLSPEIAFFLHTYTHRGTHGYTHKFNLNMLLHQNRC